MDFVYLLVVDGAEWEDLVVYLSKEEAIARSLKYPKTRIEIFSRSENGGYVPTYNFYLNGTIGSVDS